MLMVSIMRTGILSSRLVGNGRVRDWRSTRCIGTELVTPACTRSDPPLSLRRIMLLNESSNDNPLLMYLFAMLTTSLRLALTNSFFAGEVSSASLCAEHVSEDLRDSASSSILIFLFISARRCVWSLLPGPLNLAISRSDFFDTIHITLHAHMIFS